VAATRTPPASVGNTWTFLGFTTATVGRCYQGSLVYTQPSLQVYCLNYIAIDNGTTTMCGLLSLCRTYA
jgi:hypothetical protein